MALIKCTECGHEVSDKASACPNCGCPISEGRTHMGKSKSWKYALAAILLCLFSGGVYYAYTKYNDNVFNLEDGEGNVKDALVELTPEFIKAIEQYDRLGAFSEGFAAVCKEGKWGYINTKGEVVIPDTIEAFCVGRFSEGLAFVLYKEEGPFSVIDTKGEIIFQGDKIHDFWDHAESEDMPYYVDGKIYITLLTSGFDEIYDKHGNKIGKISFEDNNYDSVYKDKGNYTVFVDDSYIVGEADWSVSRTKCGLKDSIGNVIFSAKYDYIGGNYVNEEQNIDVSNGVILVILEELNENQFLGGEKDPKRYYGYADLKGNDTFTEALKERCRKAEKKAMDNYQAYLDEEDERWKNDMEERDMENTHDSSTSYSSERIVTIYIRGEFDNESNIKYESNYGISSFSQLNRRIITKSLFVPNGKVWIFKNYCFSTSSHFARYHAGFCDDSSWYYVSYGTERENPGEWKSMDNMNGERYYGGKKVYMFWGDWYGSPTNVSFSLEANFIEKDE